MEIFASHLIPKNAFNCCLFAYLFIRCNFFHFVSRIIKFFFIKMENILANFVKYTEVGQNNGND